MRHAFREGVAGCRQRALVVLIALVVGTGGCGVDDGGPGQGASSSSGSVSSAGSFRAVASVVGPRLSSGGVTTCVVRPAGQVVCWGENSAAQLGAGIRSPYVEPVEVAGLGSAVLGVSTGGAHTCAVTSEGGVKCWGRNGNGQLGDGTRVDSVVPVGVIGLGTGVAAVSAGGGHTCALTSTGAVKCWGSNASGQLGDGTRVDRTVPVGVTGLSTGVVGLSAGSGYTCAVTAGGAVKCWGDNASGQLGDGTPLTLDEGDTEDGRGSADDGLDRGRVTPSEVVGLGSGAAAVSAGNAYACAVMTAGGVKCWGANTSGELGVGAVPRHDWNGRLVAGVAFSDVPLDVVGLETPMVGVRC